MKKSINTIIRTKLQAQEEELEEEQEEEEEIGVVTPVNPKVTIHRRTSLSQVLGILPPGPRETVTGQPKQSTSALQRLKPKPKPSARFNKRGTGRIEQGTSREEGGKTQEGNS